MSELREAGFADLDVHTLYRIVQLRIDVFVVEQACAYRELDGRDVEASARHCWVDDDGEVVAYLRLLAEPEGVVRIGRVVTAQGHRRRGLADRLLAHALSTEATAFVADVQAHLVDWYAARGFAVAGGRFIEDGIPHVPMRAPGRWTLPQS